MQQQGAAVKFGRLRNNTFTDQLPSPPNSLFSSSNRKNKTSIFENVFLSPNQYSTTGNLPIKMPEDGQMVELMHRYQQLKNCGLQIPPPFDISLPNSIYSRGKKIRNFSFFRTSQQAMTPYYFYKCKNLEDTLYNLNEEAYHAQLDMVSERSERHKLTMESKRQQIEIKRLKEELARMSQLTSFQQTSDSLERNAELARENSRLSHQISELNRRLDQYECKTVSVRNHSQSVEKHLQIENRSLRNKLKDRTRQMRSFQKYSLKSKKLLLKFKKIVEILRNENKVLFEQLALYNDYGISARGMPPEFEEQLNAIKQKAQKVEEEIQVVMKNDRLSLTSSLEEVQFESVPPTPLSETSDTLPPQQLPNLTSSFHLPSGFHEGQLGKPPYSFVVEI